MILIRRGTNLEKMFEGRKTLFFSFYFAGESEEKAI